MMGWIGSLTDKRAKRRRGTTKKRGVEDNVKKEWLTLVFISPPNVLDCGVDRECSGDTLVPEPNIPDLVRRLDVLIGVEYMLTTWEVIQNFPLNFILDLG